MTFFPFECSTLGTHGGWWSGTKSGHLLKVLSTSTPTTRHICRETDSTLQCVVKPLRLLLPWTSRGISYPPWTRLPSRSWIAPGGVGTLEPIPDLTIIRSFVMSSECSFINDTPTLVLSLESSVRLHPLIIISRSGRSRSDGIVRQFCNHESSVDCEVFLVCDR